VDSKVCSICQAAAKSTRSRDQLRSPGGRLHLGVPACTDHVLARLAAVGDQLADRLGPPPLSHAIPPLSSNVEFGSSLDCSRECRLNDAVAHTASPIIPRSPAGARCHRSHDGRPAGLGRSGSTAGSVLSRSGPRTRSIPPRRERLLTQARIRVWYVWRNQPAADTRWPPSAFRPARCEPAVGGRELVSGCAFHCPTTGAPCSPASYPYTATKPGHFFPPRHSSGHASS